MRSNRQLVDGIRDRDPSAVEELISRFSVSLQDFLRSKRLRESEVSRLTGDVFLSIVDCICRNPLQDADGLHGLVWTVARRRFDLYRQETARNRGVEAARVAGAVLASMPDRDREVLIRYYLGEQIPEQICQTFHLTRRQWQHVRSQARTLFGEMGRRPAGRAVSYPTSEEVERCIA